MRSRSTLRTVLVYSARQLPETTADGVAQEQHLSCSSNTNLPPRFRVTVIEAVCLLSGRESARPHRLGLAADFFSPAARAPSSRLSYPEYCD